MKEYTLGKTGITVPQNAFGALPIQRISTEDAAYLLRKAYDGGMRFFDTARAYSDSEEKVGIAFEGMRDKVYISSKTQATTKEKFWSDLETSLKLLKTDYLDIYQLHCVARCYGEDDEIYECLKEAKRQGKIRHIGITAHKIGVAEDIVKSGLYETLQFPLSYLSTPMEQDLVRRCREHNMGFIAMKGLAGGLIRHSKAASAFMAQFDNVAPIWGIQKMSELEEWLTHMREEPQLDEDLIAFISKEKEELMGEFCRGCGYCLPCPAGIIINNCARMSLMIRRAPSASWLNDTWQENMKKIENCINCGACRFRCPYELDTPSLLKKNYEDYKRILAGEITV